MLTPCAALLLLAQTACTKDVALTQSDAADVVSEPSDGMDAGGDSSPVDSDAHDAHVSDCTVIGCDYSTPIRLVVLDSSGHPVIGYAVHLTDVARRTWTVTCDASPADGGAGCNGSVDLRHFTPTEYLVPEEFTTVQIVADAGATWSGMLTAIQTPRHPNGPACPPGCFQDPITFRFAP